ncbi:MAG: ATP-binding cassette domain-containing protein [Nitrospirae bacterium]|nr:ATP-binding cassette domain-containing protein [Nitrospirota bacterium]
MIKLEEVTTEHLNSLSLEVKEGSACKIIPDSDGERKSLLDTISGLQKPAGGSVFLFGTEIYSIPEKECISFFKRIGVVRASGGTISNIKVWENITLPVWYHLGKKPAEVEGRIIEIFEQLGISTSYLSGYMGKLPGPLPVQEKKIIALVRAMLMEPELMIYDSLFEGMSPEMAKKLTALTENFHAEKPSFQRGCLRTIERMETLKLHSF